MATGTATTCISESGAKERTRPDVPEQANRARGIGQ